MTRPLTLREIRTLLENLPYHPCSIPEVGENLRQNIIRRFSLELRKIKIPENKFEDLQESVINLYLKAISQPGTAIGMITAEAIMAPVTQNALNSFHFTGTEKGAVTGIGSIAELIYASVRKNPYLIVHFKDKNLNYEKVYQYTSSIVGLSIHSLLQSSTSYIYKKEARTPGNDAWVNRYIDMMTDEGFEDPRVEGQYFQRLKFDVSKLYESSILLGQICKELSYEDDTYTGLRCIPSPTYQGIIDVYPDIRFFRDKIEIFKVGRIFFEDEHKADENTFFLFIKRIFEPRLSRMIVKGVEGNHYMIPQSIKTLDTILSVQPCLSNPEYSMVRIDIANKRSSGVPFEKILSLFKACGYPSLWNASGLPEMEERELPSLIKSEIDEELWEYSFLVKGTKVLEDIREKIEKAEIDSPVAVHSKYFYALVGGTNLRGTVLLDFIDPLESYSNSYRDLGDILGIDATRELLIKDYENNLSDPYINPSSITNQACVQTCIGTVTSTTSTALSRKNTGALPQASFQQATESFARVAPLGRKEDVNSTSSCIFLGLPIKVGTGHSDAVTNSEVIERYGRKLELEKNIREGKHVPSFILIPHNVKTGKGDDEVVGELFEEDNAGLPAVFKPPKPIIRTSKLPNKILKLIGDNIFVRIREASKKLQNNYDPMIFLREITKYKL